MLRAMRQAAPDLPAPRPGLVLLSLRAARRTVRRVREHQAGLLPGPCRAATMRQVPGRRRTRPGHRDLRHHHRAGPSCQPGRYRRRRPPFGSPALIPAETGLGAGGTPLVADRGGPSCAAAGDPAAHRSAACRRRRRDRPSRLPPLPAGRAHRQAAGRGAGLPDVHRALAHRAVRTLRSPPRARHPRRGQAAVRELLHRRPGQPGDLHRLRAPPSGRTAHPGWAAVFPLPAAPAAGLLYLR